MMNVYGECGCNLVASICQIEFWFSFCHFIKHNYMWRTQF